MDLDLKKLSVMRKNQEEEESDSLINEENIYPSYEEILFKYEKITDYHCTSGEKSTEYNLKKK